MLRCGYSLLGLGLSGVVIACGASNTNGGGATAGAGGGSAGMTSSSGGAVSTGGSHTDGGAPPRMVGDCTKLGKPGAWEQVSIPGVSLDGSFATPAGTNYGIGNFLLDPLHSGTAYVGTSAQGIYKTTDCGATWTHINTGRNGDQLDAGRQWTMQIDPFDSQIIYTVAGYGHTNGAWKSTNGGVDWDQFFPADVASAFVYNGFTARIAMDPTDHLHLLVTPHFTCQNGHSNSCLLETKDAGTTWRVIENAPETAEGGGLPMLDSKTWLWLTQGGIWRTGDAGGSWQKVDGNKVSDGFYKGKDGTLYAAADPKILKSTDNGMTWAPIDGASAAVSLAGDGTTMFSSKSYCTGKANAPFQPYRSAAESDTSTWTELTAPQMFVGGREIAYDSDHKVLYSDNCIEGFWRVVVP